MKTFQSLVLCCVLLCGVAVLSAQEPYWQWAVKAGGTFSEYGQSIAVDSQGNQYVTGDFHGTATFGSHILTANEIYDFDVFVAKLDPNGNWLWAVNAGGTDYDGGYSIALDGADNAYVTGQFYDTATFGSHTLTSSGHSDIFVAKIDPNGNWLWAAKAGGTNYEIGWGIAVDGLDNAWITGEFRGTATFSSQTLTLSGMNDIFVAKLDSSGNWLWAVKAGGIYGETGLGIAVDGTGNARVTGWFEVTATFGRYTVTSSGEEDVFVAKLDSFGNWLWAVKAGGTGFDRGCGIAMDGAGNARVTGWFEGTARFGRHFLSSSGEKDIFIANLDPTGNWLWAVKAGGADTDTGYGIAVDGTGNAWVTGMFQGTATFGSQTHTSSGEEDVFAIKLDSSGNWLWAVKAGGINVDSGYGIAVNGAGNAYVTGWFEGTATFGSHILVADGYELYPDIFVAKISYIDGDAPPKAPENVHITLSEHSALITWDAVTENILDQPITPDGYYIYESSDPLGQFTYQGSSSDTTFILPTTAMSHPRMFYRVTAYKN